MAKQKLPARRYPDERECALKLVESVANVKDVDQILDSNPELKEALTAAQADLLESAGYDRAAYLTWVQNGETV